MDIEASSRTRLLLGDGAVEKLSRARVAIFGVGGVGGYVCEALARSGVGKFVLVDNDVVSPSNLNRQILALRSTLGRPKVDVARERILDINPDAEVDARNVFFLPETAGEFDFSTFDFVVDAIDTVSGKMELVRRAQAAGVPIICAMGAGNKLDPCRFEVTDIYKTSVCPLCRVMRGLCRKEGIRHLTVVYSKEEPRRVVVPVAPVPGADEAVPRRNPPASVVFAPAGAGLLIACHVTKTLIGQE